MLWATQYNTVQKSIALSTYIQHF